VVVQWGDKGSPGKVILVNHPEEFASVIETVNELTKQNDSSTEETKKEVEEVEEPKGMTVV